MIEEGEIVQALESILADQSVFISRLQNMEPGSKTPDEIREIESDIREAIDLMERTIRSILSSKPSPEIIGDRLKRAFNNLTLIYDLLTKLIRVSPE